MICNENSKMPLAVKVLVPLTVAMLFSSCAGKNPGELRIAEQFGLAYAPVTIAREKGFIEEAALLWAKEEQGGAGGTMEELIPEVKWLRLGNTAAIREAAAAGKVDAAFMGIPPFLISRGSGMEWQMVSALCEAPLGLMVRREALQRAASGQHPLQRIGPDLAIALPQPGSIQHILLSMAAGSVFGQPDRFDQQLKTLKHPDGMQALLSGGGVDGHFTSPPYLFVERKQPELTELISGKECFGGDFTFIVTVATERFITEEPELLDIFLAGLELGITFLKEQPQESARILAPIYGMEDKELAAMLSDPDLIYGGEVKGTDRFVEFMKRAGYLSESFSGEGLYWREGEE